MSLTWTSLLSPQEPRGAELLLKSIAQEPRVLSGEVQRVGEDLLFTASSIPSPPLPERSIVQIRLVMPHGVFQETTVAVLKGARQLQLMASGRVKLLQHREQYRFSLNYPITLTPTVGDSKGTPATLADISLGGARVLAKRPLIAGEVLRVRIEDTPFGTVAFTGQVRSTTQTNAPGPQSYGLQWIRMSEEDQSNLKQLLVAVVNRKWPDTQTEPAAPQPASSNQLVRQADQVRDLIAEMTELLVREPKDVRVHELQRLCTAVAGGMHSLRTAITQTVAPPRPDTTPVAVRSDGFG